MGIYLFPIKIAFIMFIFVGFFLIIPWLIYSYRKYGRISLWASIVAYSLIYYMLAALFLVLLPLPNTRDTCSMQSPDTVHYSLIPFSFIRDIIKSSSVVWSQPATYVGLLKQGAFLQALFNFLLLLPLGVYLRYFFHQKKYWKRALSLGFALSLFYEITQITGIYGIYNCPYRIFDVDDLILNSTGALFGFLVAPVILTLFPSRKSLIEKGEKLRDHHLVPPLSQLLAVFIDYLLIKISWKFTGGFVITNGFIEFIYTTILFGILFFVVPVVWQGKTIGTHVLRFQLRNFDGGTPSRRSLLKRAIALYLPLVVTSFLKILTDIELDIDSSFYVYQVWITVGIFAFLIAMWAVLFVHVLFILLKKGKRPFYFDDVADIVPWRE